MAFTDKIIFNQKTGQVISFIQTSKDTEGKLLEMNVTFNSKSLAPPPHYHPYQTEVFRIISGQLTININGKTVLLDQGQIIRIPPDTSHSMWNNSSQKTIVNWQIRPALQTEYFLETLFGLAGDNKTNASGIPSFLQKIVTANKYRDSLRLSQPPFLFQKIIFSLVSPIVKICGYKASYEKYFS